MNTDATLRKIRERLGHLASDWSPASWLDMGMEELNEVLGHPQRGVPYGRIIELSGLESVGKSALSLSLAACAQRDGAAIVWNDFEASFDEEWAKVRGLDTDDKGFYLVQPYIGKFGKEQQQRMISAQELCAEVERLLASVHRKHQKMFSVIDSVASMLPEGEAAAGLAHQGLPQSMELPKFLGKLLRRWVALAQSYNCTMIFINQLRQNPMQRFGDPWYTPGGNALRFYSHIRVRARLVKGGKIPQKNKVIGVKGKLTCLKNKVGGLQGAEVGYKLYFKGPLTFLEVKELGDEG